MKALFFVLTIFLSFEFANAAETFPAQARLFIGSTHVDPSNLNTEMSAQGIKKFDNVAKFGVEITYSLIRYLDIGFNYTKHYQRNLEMTPTAGQDYGATLDQDTVQFIARVPFLRTNFLRADIFGGAGGSNTTFKIKTASQDGELSRREGKDWFAEPVLSYGASVALGWKRFFLVLEGGSELNKVDSFKRKGNINPNVREIDLSGGYFQIGLMFDGVTATKR